MKNAMIKSVAVGVVLGAGATTMFAQASSGLDAANDVYNNIYPTSTGGLYPTNSGESFGNEIILAGNANDNYMTNFAFEIFGSANGSTTGSFAGAINLTIGFYANTGPATANGYLSPAATPFFSYSTSSFADENGVTFHPTLGTIYNLQTGDPEGLGGSLSDYTTGVLLPTTDFSVIFTFTGMGVGDVIGLGTVSGSDIGSVYNGYWDKLPNGSWQYLENGPDNATQMQIEAVPEPTTMALAGIGGLAMLAAAKRRSVK